MMPPHTVTASYCHARLFFAMPDADIAAAGVSVSARCACIDGAMMLLQPLI